MIHAFIQSHTTSEYEMSTPERSKYLLSCHGLFEFRRFAVGLRGQNPSYLPTWKAYVWPLSRKDADTGRVHWVLVN